MDFSIRADKIFPHLVEGESNTLIVKNHHFQRLEQSIHRFLSVEPVPIKILAAIFTGNFVLTTFTFAIKSGQPNKQRVNSPDKRF